MEPILDVPCNLNDSGIDADAWMDSSRSVTDEQNHQNDGKEYFSNPDSTPLTLLQFENKLF